MPDDKQTKRLQLPKNTTINNVIEYLEGEKELILAELKSHDATMNTTDMSVQELDAFVSRKRLYDLERYLKVIRRLSGLK